jgi:hypothetical protein
VKTILPLFTLLLVSFSLFSQPYQPVAVENAHWVMYAITPNNMVNNHAFVIRGDTIINAIAYKKIYYQELANQWPFEPPYLLEEEHIWGVVRDDSLNRSVYVIAFEPYAYGYQCPVGEEQLLFDFSISPGDTTAHCLWYEDYPWILDSTFISYKYGADRRTIYSEEYWVFGKIYEGIGSEAGLLGTLFYGEQPSEYYFSLVNYCIGSDEDCGMISFTHALPITASGLAAFPNPIRETLYLKAMEPLPPGAELAVFDLYGRAVYRGLFSDAAQGISVAAWPAGVYVAEVWDGGKRLMARVARL